MGAKQEEELVALERRYWKALQDGDIDAVLGLTDDPCVMANAHGVARLEPDALAGMMKKATYELRSFELKDLQVQRVADGVAVVTYTVREDLTVDGKPVEMTAAETSTWVRRGDAWRCALHTESILGDPFGRDRRAA
jgi:uncharacterized protein (TIGR02246 family)